MMEFIFSLNKTKICWLLIWKFREALTCNCKYCKLLARLKVDTFTYKGIAWNIEIWINVLFKFEICTIYFKKTANVWLFCKWILFSFLLAVGIVHGVIINSTGTIFATVGLDTWPEESLLRRWRLNRRDWRVSGLTLPENFNGFFEEFRICNSEDLSSWLISSMIFSIKDENSLWTSFAPSPNLISVKASALLIGFAWFPSDLLIPSRLKL